MGVNIDPNDSWDNLHGPSRPEHHWSTDNVGEAAPGVLSPLSGSILGCAVAVELRIRPR